MAGHTVVNDYGKFALHLVPCGIFNPTTRCLIGAGAVVNFDTLLTELETLQKARVDVHNLWIDRRAHVILPFHRLLDGAEEAARKDGWEVGTTKRGIGPAYADKASRQGIRVGDILDPVRLRTRLEMLVPLKNRTLVYYGIPEVTVDALMALCADWREALGERIVDGLPMVREAVRSGQRVLLEGQLGVMRDLDWGIYPYTTSSSPTAGGACIGAGIPPRAIDEVLGIVKAYSTSVGGGPFPTELTDADGEYAELVKSMARRPDAAAVDGSMAWLSAMRAG